MRHQISFMIHGGTSTPVPPGVGWSRDGFSVDVSSELDASPCIIGTLKPTISVELIKCYILSTKTMLWLDRGPSCGSRKAVKRGYFFGKMCHGQKFLF